MQNETTGRVVLSEAGYPYPDVESLRKLAERIEEELFCRLVNMYRPVKRCTTKWRGKRFNYWSNK